MISVGINSNNDSFRAYSHNSNVDRSVAELEKLYNSINASKPSFNRCIELCKKLQLIEKSLNRVGMSVETILPDEDEVAIILNKRMDKATRGRLPQELKEEELQEVVEVLSAIIAILGLRVRGDMSYFS